MLSAAENVAALSWMRMGDVINFEVRVTSYQMGGVRL
jgi:hypothetical protein